MKSLDCMLIRLYFVRPVIWIIKQPRLKAEQQDIFNE